jgi:hypothetical protein
MGQEINHEHFKPEDWTHYQQKLDQEAILLKQQFHDGAFSSRPPVGGFEIEGWLIDEAYRPDRKNDAFFQAFTDKQLVSAELAQFNIELNNTPHTLSGKVFSRFEDELQQIWQEANRAAQSIDTRMLLIGILPTIKDQDFCLANMSNLRRYHALNEQVLIARNHQPIQLDIQGEEHLQMQHDSVMLEAAATSFQIHLQVPWRQAHFYYNASLLASAPLTAAATNSPFLFNHKLWRETRIPLFEQAVNTGPNRAKRVSFGQQFAEQSILECFTENLQNYETLLPVILDQPVEKLSHLRLHNGVIWRWNRPLIGFDEDGTPHFRIEHRPLPAGPTLTDMVANAVFYYGLAESLMQQCQTAQAPGNFQQAKDNFYQAAQYGLDAEIRWRQQSIHIRQLILDELLPLAETGLQRLNIHQNEIQRYLAIIADRVDKRRTGADWQRQFVQRYGKDMQAMTKAYREQQQQNRPVSEWTL